MIADPTMRVVMLAWIASVEPQVTPLECSEQEIDRAVPVGGRVKWIDPLIKTT